MNYNGLIEPALLLWERIGGTVCQIAHFDGHPIYGLYRPVEKAMGNLLIASGIHGDEYGAVEGLLSYLAEESLFKGTRYNLYILPCLNPGGYQLGARELACGVDLNRTFHDDSHPIVKGVKHFLGNTSFEISLDLHEDLEQEKFYLWQIAQSPFPLSKRLVESVRPYVAISDQEVPDGTRTLQGIIPGDFSAVEKRISERLSGYPFAYFAAKHYAKSSLTTELPGALSLSQRINLQKILLNEFFTYFAHK